MAKPMSKPDGDYSTAHAAFVIQFGAEIADELMTEFVDGVETMLQELRAAVNNRDVKAIKTVTHRLIGLCPIYEATTLATSSKQIETELANENWGAVEILLAQLSSGYELYLKGKIA